MPPRGPALSPVPRWFWPVFALALAANLLPLLMTRYLPFNDLCGATGLVGAWAHRHDPATRVTTFFDFHVHAAPNIIFYAVTVPLSAIMPATVAANVFVAVFCVAALPFALFFALGSFRKDRTLALLAFPITYHRCLWYGFVGGVAAVPLLLVALGLANQTFVARRWGRRDLLLAGALVVLAASHAFLFLFTVAVLLVWAILAFGQPSPWWRRLAVLAPSFLYLEPFFASLRSRPVGAGRGGGAGGVIRHLWTQRRAFETYLHDARDWFLNGYAGAIDEWLAAIFVLTLVALLALGVRAAPADRSRAGLGAPPVDLGGEDGVGGPAWARWLWPARLLLAAAAAVAGYFLLPMSISQPMEWWAVNVRLLIPAVVLVVLLTRVSRRGLPRWSMLPVVAAGMIYGGYLAQDFHGWWARTELGGFSEALQAIPPGQRLLPLYPPFEAERHYSHFPMGYLADYYVVDRGGTTAPILGGLLKEHWIVWKPIGPGPFWGMARSFEWSRHARDWDYFLVKQPAPGNGPPTRAFADAPPGAVTEIFEQGLWSVWRHNR